jgi:iron complex outermembrane recepter protein
MSKSFRRGLCATSALVTSLLIAGAAMAQSTGSTALEEVVVTGAKNRSIEGLIEQTAPKSKVAIGQDFISKQMPGQSIADTLNIVPGYNFNNTDGYGNSGGNIRLRSFDGPRISLQWDGTQLNDSGNYAIFTNQQLDSELIERAEVNLGTTDVDSPTASATGGSINYITRRPQSDIGGQVTGQIGSFNFGRLFAVLDSGEIGPFGTSAFIAGSYTKYDKFKGPGELEKTQYNARIFQSLGDNGDFASIAFHYNENRNAFYRNATLAQYRQFGDQFENDSRCTRPTPVTGTAQNDNTQSNFVNFLGQVGIGSCTNYYNVRINPSNTGNIRGQFKYHILDNLIFTFDPSAQYVLANGGGFTVLSETDNRLKGAAGPTGPGRDLNGDNDTLDSVQMYTPNLTNTHRYSINTSLIWAINDTNRVRVAYARDYARHRQSAEWSAVDQNGNPSDVFGGKTDHAPRIATNDGNFMRGRDRFSIAELNMFAAEYSGKFFDNALEVRLGLRAPYFQRELNQYCYSQNGTNNVLCTTQPVATTLANGNVQFAGNTNQYITPYSAEKKYDKVLPNVGLSYRFGSNQTVYFSYAEGLSAPRTDNLYTVVRSSTGAVTNPGVEPETTTTYDLGYRYSTPTLLVSASIYSQDFQNRIVSSYDADLGVFIDRNIGSVKIQGFDGQAVWQPFEPLTLIGSISYNDSEVQSNIPLSGGLFLPTKGKTLVETPEWTQVARVEWALNDALSVNVQSKWVSERFSTDVNDEKSPPYNVWDAGLRWGLPVAAIEGAYLQVNVRNIFDTQYLGNISSQQNAVTVPGSTGFAPTYSIGAPRTLQMTVGARF